MQSILQETLAAQRAVSWVVFWWRIRRCHYSMI